MANTRIFDNEVGRYISVSRLARYNYKRNKPLRYSDKPLSKNETKKITEESKKEEEKFGIEEKPKKRKYTRKKKTEEKDK